jgi:hypothetical protein
LALGGTTEVVPFPGISFTSQFSPARSGISLCCRHPALLPASTFYRAIFAGPFIEALYNFRGSAIVNKSDRWRGEKG